MYACVRMLLAPHNTGVGVYTKGVYTKEGWGCTKGVEITARMHSTTNLHCS